MADIELVIKIPKELLGKINDGNYQSVISWYNTTLYCAIKEGTPLPEHHGDLIDKGKFKIWIETQDGDKLMTEYYLDALDMQETVVGGSYDEYID